MTGQTRNGTGRAKTEHCGAPEEAQASATELFAAREIKRTLENQEWSACTLANRGQLTAGKRRS